MVHAGYSDLRKAFKRHRLPDLAQSQSRNLLLFYAVECGLKAAWLRRNNLRSTDQLDAEASNRGHDLRQWAKCLYLSRNTAEMASNFRLRGGDGQPVSRAHEAWRYGVEIDPDDEQALAKWLDGLWHWAREELGA